MQKFPMFLMLILISGCQNTIVPIDTACSWVKPITTTAADRKAMNRQTKEEIAAHNELYDLKCVNK